MIVYCRKRKDSKWEFKPEGYTYWNILGEKKIKKEDLKKELSILGINAAAIIIVKG